jgi:DNA polymerase I-like protein with 3'-5' exonuclease and polymerase domains
LRITTLDNETTFQVVDGKKDPSPFNPNNKLVSVGYKHVVDKEVTDDYLCFFHGKQAPTPDAAKKLQAVLDSTDLLVGHNLKFDLEWLFECGFKYEGEAWDTMLCEYVFSRGRKLGMGLDDSCARYGLTQKLDAIKEYMDNDISFENIPWETVEEYGRNDVNITYDLYCKQRAQLLLPANSGLEPTVRMSNEFMLVLVDAERNGVAIDSEVLNLIEKDYREQLKTIKDRLEEIKRDVMGDTPVNLDSPEQLSQLIYSRKIIDKVKWKETFNIGTELRGSVKKKKRPAKMNRAEFVDAVKSNTQWIYRTKAEQCPDCKGQGRQHFTLKSGLQSNQRRVCKPCEGAGYIYHSTGKIAGLKCVPTGTDYAAIGGFSTDGDTLDELGRVSTGVAKEFLKLVGEYSAITTYLTSFIEGIRKNIRPSGLLHTQFMQAVTATGRLSSRGPNFQNMPRGNTFPVRRAITSRWAKQGGKVIVFDFAQLEFRCAVFQAQDKAGMQAIKEKFDVHTFTSKTLTGAGQPTDRQDAKPHTFKPLYGGTSGTPAEQAYYKAFLAMYPDIRGWQDRLQSDAINHKRIVIPSGREYAFPDAKRTKWGGSTFATQIKNYPVQGFATGDIVPCATIDLYKAFKAAGLRSVLYLFVHDSISVDVYPGEERIVYELGIKTLGQIIQTLKKRYNVDFNVPLEVDAKMGLNELELKGVKYNE